MCAQSSSSLQASAISWSLSRQLHGSPATLRKCIDVTRYLMPACLGCVLMMYKQKPPEV